MDEGWTRFVFDTFNVPYTSVRDAEIRQGGLNSKFDAIILPSQQSNQIIDGNAAGTLPAEYTGRYHGSRSQKLERLCRRTVAR